MLDNFKIEKMIISLQKMVIRRNPDANGAVTPHNYIYVIANCLTGLHDISCISECMGLLHLDLTNNNLSNLGDLGK